MSYLLSGHNVLLRAPVTMLGAQHQNQARLILVRCDEARKDGM
jgi:hypothetical protein